MSRIRILPDLVANQIAAGEVIERPASVLKELVENAIDAHATSIRIEVRGGGRSLIRVSDNGHGMGRDDAILCLERHATSKIHESADIGAIQTLGFRGEAIPSIASVSRFRLLTREAETPTGVEVEIHGGKLLSVKEAGCAVGAQVEVRQLFYNLPARRKFLRSDATELGHLHHVFFLHAIAQPRIGWTLQQDDRLIHELAASNAETASDLQAALLRRVRELHGAQLAAQLLTVDFTRDGVHLHGLIGKPGLSRSNRSELYGFVNSRPVDSRAIYYGLIEGYHTALMRGRYPVCFLFLETDPAAVDVNIHPAKREVRFRDDARVQGAIVAAVRGALGHAHSVPHPRASLEIQLPSAPALQPASAFPVTSPQDAPGQGRPSPPSAIAAGATSVVSSAAGSHAALQASFSSEIIPSPIIHHPSSGIQQPATGNLHPSTRIPHPSNPSILGVFASLYVIAMDDDGLIIVDQHAAHERILFEEMMSRLAQGSVSSQRLLLPQTVELSPTDALDLRARIPTLEKMGFGIAEFGERSFIIDAVPPFVGIAAVQQLVRAILDELNEAGRGVNRDRFAEETVARTVCRHAVKANDQLHPEELQRLVRDLMTCAHPFTCPHGRPTILRLTRTELEKKFGRRPMDGN
ncbi:MAG: DNA mismatch repair endonuclease MutL [Verrucomicrobia bacterium]|nr:DNA mismatch repair endonuclease MutL [Verrucomicrobiota bacterium]